MSNNNNNDVIILNSILDTKRQNSANNLSQDEYFEIFAFDQVLKDYDLSYDELLSNQVDGKDDGGIDGFFMFINNEALNEELDLEAIKKNPLIEVYLIQAKTSSSFGEKAIETLMATIEDIFYLDKHISDIKQFYNAQVIEKVELLRNTYLDLAIKHPQVKITYVYASKGDTQSIHIKVKNKTDNLCTRTQNFFIGSEVKFEFVGARELLESARQEKSYSLKLKFLENYISRDEDNYVVLTRLDEYYEFVTDDKGYLRKYLFESNVRDYQGNVEVNRDIKITLASKDTDIDFWWLNNGITLLASKATIAGKTITLDDVQIVNGLQTTNTIYEYMKTLQEIHDERAILVKIIVANKLEARDRIIKATNFQTPVPAASLRATEPIQRDIEDYFLHNDWFYDRRKNYYKNIGKTSNRIISIPYLAQAVTSIVHREPHTARARPTSIIKGDTNYSRVFNSSIPMEVYLFCAKSMKNIESYIRATDFSALTENNPNNLLRSGTIRILIFHLAMLFIIKLLRKVNYTQGDVRSLLQIEFDENQQGLLCNTILEITELTNRYLQTAPTLSINTVAKRSEFTNFLVENVQI
ncbi:MAG: AIPR family protein [Coleofasciculus sp. A1-SPW-01]|uniref:AIPR family protein n=1 Tax=Coleofasciculus sp. A1-SPW-01 TaxID=3070819 RepID=UPI003301BD63